MVELRPLSLDSLGRVTFREEDELESNMFGLTAHELAKKSAEKAEHSYEVWCQGEIIAFCGYKPAGLCGPCDLWMLTTPSVERHKKAFVWFVRRAIGYLRQSHPLRIIVAADYGRALRLYSRMGFSFGAPSGGFVQGMTD